MLRVCFGTGVCTGRSRAEAVSSEERRSGSTDRFRPALALVKRGEDDVRVRVPGRVLEVQAPELLERDEQLGAVGAALSEVTERGVGLLVLVHGEAGIGKTALVRRFGGQADGSVRVMWATCDPLFTPRPLGAFLDIADQLGGRLASLSRAQASRDELFTALLSELGGLSASDFAPFRRPAAP